MPEQIPVIVNSTKEVLKRDAVYFEAEKGRMM